MTQLQLHDARRALDGKDGRHESAAAVLRSKIASLEEGLSARPDVQTIAKLELEIEMLKKAGAANKKTIATLADNGLALKMTIERLEKDIAAATATPPAEVSVADNVVNAGGGASARKKEKEEKKKGDEDESLWMDDRRSRPGGLKGREARLQQRQRRQQAEVESAASSSASGGGARKPSQRQQSGENIDDGFDDFFTADAGGGSGGGNGGGDDDNAVSKPPRRHRRRIFPPPQKQLLPNNTKSAASAAATTALWNNDSGDQTGGGEEGEILCKRLIETAQAVRVACTEEREAERALNRVDNLLKAARMQELACSVAELQCEVKREKKAAAVLQFSIRALERHLCRCKCSPSSSVDVVKQCAKTRKEHIDALMRTSERGLFALEGRAFLKTPSGGDGAGMARLSSRRLEKMRPSVEHTCRLKIQARAQQQAQLDEYLAAIAHRP